MKHVLFYTHNLYCTVHGQAMAGKILFRCQKNLFNMPRRLLMALSDVLLGIY